MTTSASTQQASAPGQLKKLIPSPQRYTADFSSSNVLFNQGDAFVTIVGGTVALTELRSFIDALTDAANLGGV